MTEKHKVGHKGKKGAYFFTNFYIQISEIHLSRIQVTTFQNHLFAPFILPSNLTMFPISAGEKKGSPRHDAATAMFQGGYGVFRVIWRSCSITVGLPAHSLIVALIILLVSFGGRQPLR